MLGSGFDDLLHEDSELLAVVEEACRLTAVLDQTFRESIGSAPKPMTKLTSAAMKLQHDLYSSLSTAQTELEDLTSQDALFRACRLAMMVYNDMVLWPLPWAVGVKPRLGNHLRKVLEHLFSHDGVREKLDPRLNTADEHYMNTIFWLLYMGSVAATFTNNRHWFIEHLEDQAASMDIVTWEDFRTNLEPFLWWDYVCRNPTIEIWEECRQVTSRRMMQLNRHGQADVVLVGPER